MSGIFGSILNSNHQRLNLLHHIQQSNQRMLKRKYNSCRNDGNTGIEQILKCMFNTSPNPVTYYDTSKSNIAEGVSVWQGMAPYNSEQIIICGTTLPTATTGQGLIYLGNIECNIVNPEYYILSVPDASYSSVYGPRYNNSTNEFTFVGSYNNPGDTNTYGFLFRGPINELDVSSNYILKMNYINNPTEYLITFTHSTDGNFAVGNSGEFSGIVTNSWVYNITTASYTTFMYPGSATTTVYGIIKNTNDTYTLVGGYSVVSGLDEKGFIVDMNTDGTTFTNWTSLQLSNFFTHFEGISATADPNVYTLAADAITPTNLTLGYAITVQRTGTTFNITKSVQIDYGGSIKQSGVTTSNSILNNNVVGLFIGDTQIAFQATINI